MCVLVYQTMFNDCENGKSLVIMMNFTETATGMTHYIHLDMCKVKLTHKDLRGPSNETSFN